MVHHSAFLLGLQNSKKQTTVLRVSQKSWDIRRRGKSSLIRNAKDQCEANQRKSIQHRKSFQTRGNEEHGPLYTSLLGPEWSCNTCMGGFWRFSFIDMGKYSGFCHGRASRDIDNTQILQMRPRMMTKLGTLSPKTLWNNWLLIGFLSQNSAVVLVQPLLIIKNAEACCISLPKQEFPCTPQKSYWRFSMGSVLLIAFVLSGNSHEAFLQHQSNFPEEEKDITSSSLQGIKEGKIALTWARLSGHVIQEHGVRLYLVSWVSNLGNFFTAVGVTTENRTRDLAHSLESNWSKSGEGNQTGPIYHASIWLREQEFTLRRLATPCRF